MPAISNSNFSLSANLYHVVSATEHSNTFQLPVRFNQAISNYIFFTKLPWPGDSEGTFRSLSQAATCLPHTVEASHCPFNC